METKKTSTARNYKPLIWILTLGINGLIILAFFLPGKETFKTWDFSFLPLLNAVLNGSTFVFLFAALAAIRQKKNQTSPQLYLGSFLMHFTFSLILFTLPFHYTIHQIRRKRNDQICLFFHFDLPYFPGHYHSSAGLNIHRKRFEYGNLPT